MVKKSKDNSERIEQIKNSLKANEDILHSNPQLEESLTIESKKLEEELKELER